MRRISARIVREDDEKHKHWWPAHEELMDGSCEKRSEECSFAEKDEAILMSSFPLDQQGCHRFGVYRQRSAFRRLEPPPSSFTHLPSSSSVPAFEQSSLACASTTEGKEKN